MPFQFYVHEAMKKKRSRQNKARLGKVAPATAPGPMFSVQTDRKCLYFRKLYARQHETINVPLSEVLDMALHRRYALDDQTEVRFAFIASGIQVTRSGFPDVVVSFRDLFDISQRQRLLFS